MVSRLVSRKTKRAEPEMLHMESILKLSDSPASKRIACNYFTRVTLRKPVEF